MSCQEIINKKYRFINTIKNLEQILRFSLIKEEKGNINKLFLEKRTISYKNTAFLNTKKNKKMRLRTRGKLIMYSTLMLINQIPFLNKFLIDRDTLFDKIKKTIEDDKHNKN